MFDFLNNSVMENRTRNKKTVRRLLDKYGTLDNFMQNSTMAEDLEYKLAQGDSIVDEVERERQAMMKAMNSLPKQQGSSLDDNDMMRNARANQYRNSLLQTTHDSYLFSNPLPPIGDRSTLKQYANNQLSSMQSDVSVGNSIDKEIFERVLNRTLKEEGGYEDRENMIDTPTNMGIQQKTLDTFKLNYPDISQNYPDNVKNLTYNQAKKIAKLIYFDKYRIKEIKHKPLQELMFDSFFNHSPSAPAIWAQRAINKHTSMTVTVDGVMGTETITALNKLSKEEVIKVNNAIVDMRLDDYKKEKKTNKNPYYKNYTKGLPARFESFIIK